jgi:type IV pilus assembly protein PilE
MIGSTRRGRGFTLIEVLAASAASLVLAAIAWPSYVGQLQRAGRNEAVEALQRLQLAQERHRDTFGTYARELRGIGQSAASVGGLYDIELRPTGAESYQAFARPRAGTRQQGDQACPALTIEVQQGFATLGPSGRCWNR